MIWLILDRDKYHNRLCFWWTKQSHMDLFVITLKAKRMMIFDLINSLAYLVKCDLVGIPSTNSKRLNELWTVPRYKLCIFFIYFIPSREKTNPNWAPMQYVRGRTCELSEIWKRNWNWKYFLQILTSEVSYLKSLNVLTSHFLPKLAGQPMIYCILEK